ncbi:hypothetical protein VHEMI05964 [[Torrubiella] hemipterigena]|uniref:Uncharacterized protein n=1 Tax=[Torrubiella] hemipterigena TaxID=1531966 RepID=A0A0A1TID3_9HYPO|nr:hypothetical protein VHEMI05964 [[Torrubiella] hemipterigena]
MTSCNEQNLSLEAIYEAFANLGVGSNEPLSVEEFQGANSHIFKVSFKDHPSLSVRIGHLSQSD